ncbi:MAG: hypothetical protein ACYC6N_16350 [Pirellulaceae bacterium]
MAVMQFIDDPFGRLVATTVVMLVVLIVGALALIFAQRRVVDPALWELSEFFWKRQIAINALSNDVARNEASRYLADANCFTCVRLQEAGPSVIRELAPLASELLSTYHAIVSTDGIYALGAAYCGELGVYGFVHIGGSEDEGGYFVRRGSETVYKGFLRKSFIYGPSADVAPIAISVYHLILIARDFDKDGETESASVFGG